MTRRVSNMNGLELLLARKYYNIKDFYTETLLIMCHTLIAQYLSTDDEENKDQYITREEHLIIKKSMEELYEYLNETIISYPRLDLIIKSAPKSKKNIIKAQLVEPYMYYYNILAEAFVSRLNYVTQKDEKQFWIPDLLAISLITDLKEKQRYDFRKFEFIKEYDFNKLIEIYAKANQRIKKNENILMTTPIHEQTLVRKMASISSFMIEKLLSTKYNKKKSKKRKK